MMPVDPAPTRLTADEYFDLVARGQLAPDDRVELLEGVVVSMSPQNPPHAGAIEQINEVLVLAFHGKARVRTQLPLVAGQRNVPEPDFAVVPPQAPGQPAAHPNRAHLVIEVADSSLPTDRLSKSRIYAAAEVPQYLIVNLRDDTVETFERPNPELALYEVQRVLARGAMIQVVAFPDLSLATDDLLPITSAPH